MLPSTTYVNKKQLDILFYYGQFQERAFVLLTSTSQIWAEVFAKALEGKDIKEVLSGFHAAGSAAGSASAGGAAAAGSGEAAEEAAEEEDKEESDDDMGFGLFD